jgi:hypothetical protein
MMQHGKPPGLLPTTNFTDPACRAGRRTGAGSLTDNCTTAIRTRRAASDRAPWDWRLLVNGHLDELLYERGTIDTHLPFAELKKYPTSIREPRRRIRPLISRNKSAKVCPASMKPSKENGHEKSSVPGARLPARDLSESQPQHVRQSNNPWKFVRSFGHPGCGGWDTRAPFHKMAAARLRAGGTFHPHRLPGAHRGGSRESATGLPQSSPERAQQQPMQ